MPIGSGQKLPICCLFAVYTLHAATIYHHALLPTINNHHILMKSIQSVINGFANGVDTVLSYDFMLSALITFFRSILYMMTLPHLNQLCYSNWRDRMSINSFYILVTNSDKPSLWKMVLSLLLLIHWPLGHYSFDLECIIFKQIFPVHILSIPWNVALK